MKSNQSGLKVYLLLVFLVPYLLWGIILLAQELGWFNYGESFSVILVVLAANCPAIAAFFAFRREQTDYSLKKFAKSSFDIFFVGGSEELGWRNYLQPTLEKKFSFIPATLITSLIWVAWHLPLFLIVGTSQNSSNLLSFSFYAIGASFAMAAIRRVTKSTWLCVMFHCMTNAMQGSLPLIDDLFIKLVGAIVLVAAALIVIAFHHTWSQRQLALEK